ncbi:MAG TPA: hypothetical protein VF188_14800 [Longimicrobiales bacterium]
MASTLRFLREYLHPHGPAVTHTETGYRREGQALPASLYRPAGRTGPRPTWIVLHGITYHGRRHAALERFARALAASGAAVFVPEVPEWRRLEVAPAVTAPTIASSIEALLAADVAVPERIGVFGFSFGATHGLASLTDPALLGRVRAMAAWGGYYDLHDLFRFGLTGEHEIDGIRRTIRPDPYGAWVMGANYLTHVPEHAADHAVAGALRRLAEESGRRGVFAGAPVYDGLKAELRAPLPPEQQAVFDLFAPPAGRLPDDFERAVSLAAALADAALGVDPLLDPAPRLAGIRARTLIAHGRDDCLVPYTESIRLSRALPPGCCVGCVVTPLFGHSGGTPVGRHPLRAAREGLRFVQLLRDTLGLV